MKPRGMYINNTMHACVMRISSHDLDMYIIVGEDTSHPYDLIDLFRIDALFIFFESFSFFYVVVVFFCFLLKFSTTW